MIGNYFFSSTGAAAGYQIEQSLRFDGSSHLNRRPMAHPTSDTTWTFSCWLKLTSTSEGCPISAGLSGIYTALFYSVGGEAHFRLSQYAASNNNFAKSTTARYRDPGAWYHLVTVFDSTNTTASDRIRYYINGVRVTDFSNDGSSITNVDPNSDQDTAINAFYIYQRIGSQYDGTYAYLKGYMAEAHMLDGTAVTDAEDFGELDDNGVWRPIEVSGVTYGTNGWYMKFDPSATNGIGHDHSGNGNNFTASGFTTSGTGTDVMDDTPTTNYATWNPVEESDTWNAYGVGMSNGNLQYGTNNYWNTFTSTIAFSSGKWYYELEVTGNNQGGIVASDWTGTPGVALADGGALGYNRNDGKIYEDNNSGTSYGNTFTGTHTLGIAVDADTDKFYFAIDNTWQNSANPSSGTGGYSITMGSKPWRFAASAYSCTGQIANFGQRAFIYTPPTGFKALNTANLPAPDIADGSKNFGIKLYQGNEGDVSAPATQTITDLKFAPDFVWIKCRNSGTANHSLFDQVRGTGKTLWSNSVSNEQTNYTRGYLSAFTSDGFTVRAGNTDARDVNGLGTTGSPPTQYVAWNWKAGGSGSSNTAGTITSTVSANPSAGFSIVSYTGNSTDNATVGHGLGVKPDFVIIKNRDNGNTYPFAWHKSFGNEEIIWLSEADTKQTPGTRYIRFGNNTATVFSLGTNNEANAGDDYIAYCFAEVEGYSKFGSYTGNANANGPFVYCGFRPAWVLIKVTNIGTTNWIVFDSVRQTYNVIGPWLMPSATNAEIVSDYIDFLSNGFKLRVSNNLVNGSGTYIFAAFAEHPFGGDGVSPATAR